MIVVWNVVLVTDVHNKYMGVVYDPEWLTMVQSARWNTCQQNSMIIKSGATLKHKYIGILALMKLKTATGVAETCRWSLCNKITFIKPKCIWGLFNKFSVICTMHNNVCWNV